MREIGGISVVARRAASTARRRQRGPSLPIAALLLLTLCARGSVAADGLDSEACLACHAQSGFAVQDRPLVVDAASFRTSAHGPLNCTVCHVDATEVPHADHLQPVDMETTCGACHGDAIAAYQHSVHGGAGAEGAHGAATCTDCHGSIHALKPHTDPDSIAHWSKLATTCGRCHGNAEMAEQFHIPVVRPVEAYLGSVHARRVAAGERGAVCADCHGAHDIRAGSDRDSSTGRLRISTTCGRCHPEVLATYQESVHGVALARGNPDVPVCTDCHGEHRILGAGESGSPVFAANVPGETCGRCHGDARLSSKYGLATGNVAAFQDSFHGLALRAGQVRVANCASCHGVHDIRPSSDPRSHVNPANLPATCGKCHPGAGRLFALGPVHSPTGSTGAWAVSWVRTIYLWLIGLTIGFMAVHNLLNFARKVRRPSPPPRAPENRPERMTRRLRWQHGLVMISFPTLAYTGFGLKYPESWWAGPMRWEAAIGLRGTAHRVAAVVLVGAVVWHLWDLATKPRLRACFRGLLFATKDLGALLHSLAYDLGLRRTPPHGAVFTYAEKAEYWAFLWGTFIMGVTGSLLWFENLSLRLLPSWLLDVVTAVHFYEAILATLAILVWHFYFVIFDPDVYPMDLSWWHGRSPASRALERQPDPGEAPSADRDA